MGSIWTALGNRLETAWKRPTKPNSKRPKDGEIIDEEKSVRWNREEVVRRQKAWDAECSRLKKAQNAEIEHISEAIELQIQEDIKAKTKRSMQGFRVNDSPVKIFSTSKPNVTNLTRYTTNAAPAISFGLLPL